MWHLFINFIENLHIWLSTIKLDPQLLWSQNKPSSKLKDRFQNKPQNVQLLNNFGKSNIFVAQTFHVIHSVIVVLKWKRSILRPLSGKHCKKEETRAKLSSKMTNLSRFEMRSVQMPKFAFMCEVFKCLTLHLCSIDW